MEFNQLFKPISPKELWNAFNLFKLVAEDFYLITAGKKDHYNSMVGSGGGFGTLFKKPSSWCLLKSDRYTLKIMEKEQSYTLSYFPDQYKSKMLFLGSKSGENSDKMKEVESTSIQTPNKDMTFEEALLVIECKLTQITTPDPKDFCSLEAKDYIKEAYKEPNDYRKYVFGEITHIWVKNKS